MRVAPAAAERVPAKMPSTDAGTRPELVIVPVRAPLAYRCAAEALGTFLLVFLGLGAVHAAVLADAQSGVWQVAIVWAIAIAVAIHATGSISGAHINPAITAAFAVFGDFRRRDVLPYWMAQLVGAFAGAALLYALFGGLLTDLEAAAGVVRGGPGSEISAMCYGEYFPNPGLGTDAAAWAKVPMLAAFAAELVGTAILALVVFAVTERRNPGAPGTALTPLVIGLTVAALISVLAPLSQAGFNPARDFGPRLFAWLAGWGTIAIPGPRGGFFVVYVIAPLLGALAGAGLFRLVLRPALPTRSAS
jgi:glycerol uptake facilitator protein